MPSRSFDTHILQPLPAGFAQRFSAQALERDGSTVVALDPEGAIVWMNPAWHRFAADNDGAAIADRFGVGVRYCSGISGELGTFFEESFERCYVEGSVFEVEYECSSACERRFMRLRALPISGAGLLLVHSNVACSSQMPMAQAAPERDYVNAQGVIVQCSNCRRAKHVDAERWDWVPHWVAHPDPRVSHGLCDICVGFYWKRRRPTG